MQNDLHSQIMNLPKDPAPCFTRNDDISHAYQEGHRDARNAAAELVAKHQASSAPKEMREANPETPNNDLRSRIRGALQPFARMAAAFREYDSELIAYSHGIVLNSDDRPEPVGITFGDYNAAESVLVELNAAAPTGMSREEAFELLEGHCGPKASICIHEESNRYFIHTTRRDEDTTWVIFVGFGDNFTSFRRESLSECVAAALSNVPKYRKE